MMPKAKICRARKCKWLDWRKGESEWKATCVIASMTGFGVYVPDKGNPKRATSYIWRMSECPSDEFKLKAYLA
jgi:hypothetical protein